METIDMAIVGGGVSGLTTALYSVERKPGSTIVVFEKHSFLGKEQSGRNSGVAHSGYQYPPESLKSKLCLQANPLLKRFAAEHGIPYANTGKLIVATLEEELPLLRSLYDRAKEKGVDIEYLTREAIRELELNVDAIAGFNTRQTGIIDAATYVRDLAKIVEQKEGLVLRKAKINNIVPVGDDFVLHVTQDSIEYEVQAGLVVNAAGLFADEVARWVNPKFPYIIKPLRGEFMKFNKHSRPELWMQGMNVYPVPQPIPGMYDQWGNQKAMAGVHLTPTFDMSADGTAHIGNTVLLGPLGRPVESKTDYTRDRCGPQAFIERIRPLFPQLHEEDLVEDQVGIQVKIRDYDDYIIARDTEHPNFANMFCDSPGMSGSLANGRYMVYEVLKDWHVRR